MAWEMKMARKVEITWKTEKVRKYGVGGENGEEDGDIVEDGEGEER